MADPTPKPPAEQPAPRRTIVVPTPPRLEESEPAPLVSTGDLGSASRSCLAIIVVLLFIALLLCVFLAVQTLR